MKKCPYCAEEIQDEAVKCRYCGEFLDGFQPPQPQEPKLPWHFRPTAIVIVALSVAPMALPMVWWHPKMSPAWKAAATVVILLLAWAQWALLIGTLNAFDEAMKMIQGNGAF